MKRYTFLIQPIFPKKPKKPKKITCKMVKTIASVESHLDISPSIVSPLSSHNRAQPTLYLVTCYHLCNACSVVKFIAIAQLFGVLYSPSRTNQSISRNFV